MLSWTVKGGARGEIRGFVPPYSCGGGCPTSLSAWR